MEEKSNTAEKQTEIEINNNVSAEKPETGEGKRSFIQFVKFALVGVMNTLVDMVISTLVSLLLGSGGIMIYISKTIGYSCGILNSYVFNSRWTFKKERRQDAREILSFIAVNLFVLAVSFGLIWVFGDLMRLGDKWMAADLPARFIKIIDGKRACMLLSTAICIFVNFIGNKLFVFKRKTNENGKAGIKNDVK